MRARTERVATSAALERPGVLAAGPRGVFVADFSRDTVRRLDPRSLRPTARLRLRLPYEVSPGDRAFLPNEVAAAADGVWIATRRGVLVHADERLRVLGRVRLPPATTGGLAVAAGSVWVGQSLLGAYRVDARTYRVTARVRIGSPLGAVSAERLFAFAGTVLVVGARAGANLLAVVDARRRRVVRLSPLPRGRLAVASSGRSLWLGRVGGSTVVRIDGRTGLVAAAVGGRVGVALAFAAGRLWTVTADGTVRPALLR